MTTLWLYRINIIVLETDKSALNALWTVIAPEGDNEVNTFGAPLSAEGQEPVTHRGISTSATEEMRIFIQEIYAEELVGCVVSVQDYTVNDWNEFLVTHGLQVIQQEII